MCQAHQSRLNDCSRASEARAEHVCFMGAQPQRISIKSFGSFRVLFLVATAIANHSSHYLEPLE
jgi:hypothetical protein